MNKLFKRYIVLTVSIVFIILYLALNILTNYQAKFLDFKYTQINQLQESNYLYSLITGKTVIQELQISEQSLQAENAELKKQLLLYKNISDLLQYSNFYPEVPVNGILSYCKNTCWVRVLNNSIPTAGSYVQAYGFVVGKIININNGIVEYLPVESKDFASEVIIEGVPGKIMWQDNELIITNLVTNGINLTDKYISITDEATKKSYPIAIVGADNSALSSSVKTYKAILPISIKQVKYVSIP